jgi:hypothetical protein
VRCSVTTERRGSKEDEFTCPAFPAAFSIVTLELHFCHRD